MSCHSYRRENITNIVSVNTKFDIVRYYFVKKNDSGLLGVLLDILLSFLITIESIHNAASCNTYCSCNNCFGVGIGNFIKFNQNYSHVQLPQEEDPLQCNSYRMLRSR